MTDLSIGFESQSALEALGETLGEFKAYDPQNPPAYIEGTRVVKCLYKHTANAKDKRSNEYVRVPDHITEESVRKALPELMDYFVGFLQDTEDKLIKEDHKKYISRVYTEYLSIDKLIEFLESQESSGRLTKEKIGAWFDAYMLEPLTDLFLTKTEDEEKIAAVLSAYKGKFESLAGGRTFIKKQDCEAMLKAMDESHQFSAVNDSSIGKRFRNRLLNMEEKENDLLLSL